MPDLAYLDEHRAYIGASGSGKSTTARGHVEQLLREKRHTLVTDHLGVWWGLRSNAAGTGPGFDIPIFGGRKADVPITPADGAAIGRIVADGVSAIVDLSGIRDGLGQRVFMRDLVAAIREKPPGHFQFIADEADEDVPEKVRDDAGFALQENMIWIAKRGRSDGFVLSLITQRPASMAKEALSQCQTIFAHQLVLPLDTKAFGAFVREHGTREEYRQIMARLPSLQVGERYLYRPKDHRLELGRSPRPETFDSSRTPGPGETRREPRMLAQLDVSAIAAALQKPKVEAALAAYESGAAAGQLLVEKDAQIAALKQRLERIQAYVASIDDLAGYRLGCLEEIAAIVGRALNNVRSADADIEESANEAQDEPGPLPGPATLAEGEALPRGPSKARRSASPDRAQSSNDPNVRRGRKALLALARIYPAMLTEKQWATLAGYAQSGGTWGTYKGVLRAGGLIEEEGGLWGATAAGVAAAGIDPDPLPDPGPELALYWSSRIPGVRRMVDVLVKRWPHFTTREGLAADLHMSASGGTFGTYLGRLRSNGLLEEQKARLRLAPAIMGGAA